MGKEQTGRERGGLTTNEARKSDLGKGKGAHSLQGGENKTMDPKILQCI